MILLDTCTLLWLAIEPSALSDRAKRALRSHAGGLHVSAISAFEIGQKAAGGKLKLKLKPSLWFPRACELHGIDPLPLDIKSCLAAAALPQLHKDPFDRLLVATALTHGLAILTPDEKIRAYPKLKSLW